MIKLDPTKRYYLSHPCTSFGTMAENKRHEQECFEKIQLKQSGIFFRYEPEKNKIKCTRPLKEIPEEMPWEAAMQQCFKLMEPCDAIIMCGQWEKSSGCLAELTEAKGRNMGIFMYEDVV